MSELFSVIITTYNRSDSLLSILNALTRQTDRHFEVVIADDGSQSMHVDTVCNAPVAQQLGLTYVWHPDVGFTAARVRNLGARASTGDYLLFLDGDCVPENDWISQHRRLKEDNCFINGSRVLLSPALSRQITTNACRADGHSYAYWIHQRLTKQANKMFPSLRFPNGAFRKEVSFRWKQIRSCNFSVTKRDFEKVNGFDETFHGWGHEDADFVLRLHHAKLVRKNGFFATEVYHLWHKEAERNMESTNAQEVRRRIEQPSLIRAVCGYDSVSLFDDSVQVTKVKTQ